MSVRYVAFLRAVNVGGNNLVKMETLRGQLSSLGLARVESFIASGNLIFETAAKDPLKLRQRIERHLSEQLGREVAAVLRTDTEVAAVAAARPFGADDAPVALNVGFLYAPLDAVAAHRLADFDTAVDRFATRGAEIYWRCDARQSDSRYKPATMERALGVPIVTFRSITTVGKLAAKYPPAAAGR